MFSIFIVSYYYWVRRYGHKKSIDGSTVLITNGCSDLSKEISRQLISIHNCKVILVINEDNNTNNEIDHSENIVQYKSNNVNELIYNYNIQENYNIEKLLNQIEIENIGIIDILIENGIDDMTTNCDDNSSTKEGCEVFIDKISKKFQNTINLFINFMPKLMKSSTGGHFVSIQAAENLNNSSPMLDPSDPDIQNLLIYFQRHQSDDMILDDDGISFDLNNNEVDEPEQFNINNIDNNNDNNNDNNVNDNDNYDKKSTISTIIYKKSKYQNKYMKKFNLNMEEIVDRIIDKIQNEEKFAEVSEQISLIEFILKLIKF